MSVQYFILSGLGKLFFIHSRILYLTIKCLKPKYIFGRIRRIIQKSAGQYGGVSKTVKRETREKQLSKPPCVELQNVNGG